MKHLINNIEYTLSMTYEQDNIVVASVIGVSYWNPTRGFDSDEPKIGADDFGYLIQYLNQTWRTAQDAIEESKRKAELEEKNKSRTVKYPYLVSGKKFVNDGEILFGLCLNHGCDTIGGVKVLIIKPNGQTSKASLDEATWLEAEDVVLQIKE